MLCSIAYLYEYVNGYIIVFMAKQDIRRDEKLQRDVTTLWYKNYTGKVAIVQQYSPSDMVMNDNINPETVPIYVGFDGSLPMDLITVLEDYERLKEQKKIDDRKYEERLDRAFDRIIEIENQLPNFKKKYVRWSES